MYSFLNWNLFAAEALFVSQIFERLGGHLGEIVGVSVQKTRQDITSSETSWPHLICETCCQDVDHFICSFPLPFPDSSDINGNGEQS